MKTLFEPGRLLARARRRAGLSQRELAHRAGTSQSVIARIERGRTSPGGETLERLLAEAGFELRVELRPRRAPPNHMLADVARILRLTPEERLREVANAARFVAAARRV
ncbi:MAG: helix-turn-helix transcriptional regulator [Pseudomonadota bacterium]